jgi:glycosyltransferase involved in cell wall biosynthesis
VAHLQLLTAIVCVSRSQFEFFAAAAPKVPRHHVPLGVDTAFFTPGAGPCADRPNLLCVGEHLRDWQTLLAVYERARVALHDCTLTVVTPPDGFPKHLRREGITVLQGLSDLELLQAYRSAHVLVLPLLDGTASNTALEAMACGIPVIASNIPSMEEYLGDEAGLLCPIRDLDAMVDSTLRVLQDSDLRRALGARARTRAELFNWPCIFEQLQAVYDSVMH